MPLEDARLAQSLADVLPKIGDINSKIIHDLITEHAAERLELIRRYKRLNLEEDAVPVLQRDAPSGVYEKINNKLVHDYPGSLVKTKAAYVAGIPPSIDYRPQKAEPPELAPGEEETFEAKAARTESVRTDQKALQRWLRINDFSDLMNETALRTGNEGQSAWLVFLSQIDALPRIRRYDPWEMVWIYNRRTSDLDAVLRYYEVEKIEILGPNDYKTSTIYNVEWWDKERVVYYEQSAAGSSEYVRTEGEGTNPAPHPFGQVPWIKIRNNSMDMGDWQVVESLVDGQDSVKSNLENDIEQFAAALIKFIGWEPSPDDIKAMAHMGGLKVPEDGDVAWLVKEILHEPHEFFLRRNDTDIHKLAGIPDFGSDDFSGNTPIISIRMKLFKLEALSIILENKMTYALRLVMDMATPIINEILKVAVDPMDINWEWTRNLPVNHLEEAKIQSTLKGFVSDRTRLGLASFVDDYGTEIAQMEADTARNGTAFPELDEDTDEADDLLEDDEE